MSCCPLPPPPAGVPTRAQPAPVASTGSVALPALLFGLTHRHKRRYTAAVEAKQVAQQDAEVRCAATPVASPASPAARLARSPPRPLPASPAARLVRLARCPPRLTSPRLASPRLASPASPASPAARLACRLARLPPGSPCRLALQASALSRCRCYSWQRARFVVEKAMQDKKSTIIRAQGEAKSAKLIGDAVRDNPGFIELRKLEAARDIATTVSKSNNRVFLDSHSLMLNVQDKVKVDLSVAEKVQKAPKVEPPKAAPPAPPAPIAAPAVMVSAASP